MSGSIDLHVDLTKGGMQILRCFGAVFVPGRIEPRYTESLTFAGLPVPESDQQRYLDTTLTYRRAWLHAIECLPRFGYTREQAHLILVAAPIESRLSGVVDIPNACAALYLPTAISDTGIRPGAGTPARGR